MDTALQQLLEKKYYGNTQNSFISSTFWTERIGPTAALKTLEVMERIKSWEKISNTGKFIKKEWNRIALLKKLTLQFLEFLRYLFYF